MQELIEFELFGLTLQEPMALLTNWLMSVFCLYAYMSLKSSIKINIIYWKWFFLIFSISTFFGGLSHLFFQYFGIEGKYINWVTGVISGYYLGKAMLFHFEDNRNRKKSEIFLIIKSIVLLVIALYLKKFIFIAIDAIITYVYFTGILGYILYKKGVHEMRFMVIGVLIGLPSAFIFILKINPHKWLNKDDLSHLLMLGCLYFIFKGVKQLELKNANDL